MKDRGGDEAVEARAAGEGLITIAQQAFSVKMGVISKAAKQSIQRMDNEKNRQIIMR